MKSFIQNIENRIKKNIRTDKIEILDNTHKHKKHKTFKKNKFHLTLLIESEELRLLSRIDAHKKIMKILSEDLKNQIHALEIKIK